MAVAVAPPPAPPGGATAAPSLQLPSSLPSAAQTRATQSQDTAASAELASLLQGMELRMEQRMGRMEAQIQALDHGGGSSAGGGNSTGAKKGRSRQWGIFGGKSRRAAKTSGGGDEGEWEEARGGSATS